MELCSRPAGFVSLAVITSTAFVHIYSLVKQWKLNIQFQIIIANETHLDFAQIICDEMALFRQSTGYRHCQTLARIHPAKDAGRQSRDRLSTRMAYGPVFVI